MSQFLRGCLGAGKMLWTFATDERGATAVEYGIIVAGVAVAIAGVVFTVGTDMSTMFYNKLPAAFASR